MDCNLQPHPADRICFHHTQADFVPKQVPYVVNAVQDHCRPLQTKAPGDNVDIWWQTHRLQHLWSEHAAVAHFHPLTKLRRVPVGKQQPETVSSKQNPAVAGWRGQTNDGGGTPTL